MTINWRALIMPAVMLVLSLVAWYYHSEYLTEHKRANDATTLASQRQDTINDMTVRQRDNAELDAKYTKELADANAENNRLRADIVAGKRRLQIAATCSKDETTGASGLVDGSSPRLTADAELNYWRLRDGIATVTKQLTGLQEYVRTQCLK